ncbi:V-set and transmembrane domain-containing protein 5 [Boleophthalmus pectinirostris]|uniref:V-set and transmembrane domain-containing protein 5 n=1 Tax=Boleophthalmus pectinirostris TaxID=150288 RepID=UPI00242FD054|nr:V-set and transmembrane domain-containing protein 5 [Boleophthalmus pectinirostris]
MWWLWGVIGLALSVWYIEAGAISIQCGQRTLTRAVQDDVHFSVAVECNGAPTLRWSFMSGSVSRDIGTWQPGNFTNITADYSDRAQAFANGSMLLSNLRVQDAGFYVLTVTEGGGSSRDVGFVLKVTEVLYEDLQYLSVSALALGCVAALLMFCMWLLDRLYHRVRAWRCRKRMPEADETELQML